MVDKNQKKQELKIFLWSIIGFSLLVNPLWTLLVAGLYILKLKEIDIPDRNFNCGCGLILLVGVVGCVISGNGIANILSTSHYFFELNSPRIALLAIVLFILRYAWDVMTKKPEELMVIEEKKKQAESIPLIEYPFLDGHTLIAGTTGSGKTVCISNCVEDALKKNRPVMIVNGKQDSFDSKGLYQVTKYLCEKYGVPCYLVSTDVRLSDSYSYSFSENRTRTDIINGFASSLRIKEPYYKSRFMDWLDEICKIIEILGKTISIDNILVLYDYDDFMEVVEFAKKSNLIDDTEYKRLHRNSIKETARDASASKSRLKNLVVDEGASLFGRDRTISAEEVIEQKAVLIVEVNSMKAQEVSELGAMLITADFASVISSDINHNQKKLIIYDEIGETFSQKVEEILKLAREFGFYAVFSNQALSEIETIEPGLLDSVIENIQNYIFLRQNSPLSRETAARIMGTQLSSEITHRLDGVNYDPVGSAKIIEKFKANPNMISELHTCESIVYIKLNTTDLKSKTTILGRVIWKWIDTSD